MHRIVIVLFLAASLCVFSTVSSGESRRQREAREAAQSRGVPWGLVCASVITGAFLGFTLNGQLAERTKPEIRYITRIDEKPSAFPKNAKVSAFYPSGPDGKSLAIHQVTKLIPGQVYIVVQDRPKDAPPEVKIGAGGFQLAVEGENDIHLEGVFLQHGARLTGKQLWRQGEEAKYIYSLVVNGYQMTFAQIQPSPRLQLPARAQIPATMQSPFQNPNHPWNDIGN